MWAMTVTTNCFDARSCCTVLARSFRSKDNMKTLFLALYAFFLSINIYASSKVTLIKGRDLVTDENVQVNSQDKKGMVIVFLSAKCPCSNSHNEELRSLHETFKEFNFLVSHSNLDEAPELAKSYFKKLAFAFPVIHDEKAKLADELKAYKTPHAFVFSREGEILYQGGISNSNDCKKADKKYLREALEDLHAGKTVRTPEGRTLGCAISRGVEHVW